MNRAWLWAELVAYHLRVMALMGFTGYHAPSSEDDDRPRHFASHDDAARWRQVVAERRAHEDVLTLSFWTRAA